MMLYRLFIFFLFYGIVCSVQGQNVPEEQCSPQLDSVKSPNLVYFLYPNSSSWENTSQGLPTQLNLGDIAVSENMLGILSKETGVYLFDFDKDEWGNIPTDNEIITNNPTATSFFKDKIYVGTQTGGIYVTSDLGRNWNQFNQGLTNTSIRKFSIINGELFVATNGGLFSFNQSRQSWELEYGNKSMQVNGITVCKGYINIGTNQGIFSSPIGKPVWKNVLPNYSLHNISSDDKYIYAMTYNELLISADAGTTWQSSQNGLPKELYTFNIMKNGDFVFAGQWDGVYRREDAEEKWQPYGQGLPPDLSITKMNLINGILVVGSHKRGLRNGPVEN